MYISEWNQGWATYFQSLSILVFRLLIQEPINLSLFLAPFAIILFSSCQMSIPETKEHKAEWTADIELPQYTLKDVTAHNTKGDTWMIIHGQGNITSRERQREGKAVKKNIG